MKRLFETRIRVPLPPRQALPLFTPKGEEDWVPGWQPRYHEPKSGQTQTGMVFETGEGDGRTLWTCLEWDTAALRASYLRVVPGNRVSRVYISCKEDAARQSEVTVRYEHIAISAQGETWLSELTQEKFEVEIDEWQGYIANALADGRIATRAA